MSPDVVLITQVLLNRTSYGKTRLYHGVLIQCQRYHGRYTCPCGRVAMSDIDGMASSTQVPAVRYLWLPMAVFCHAMQ
jgi:hypothetical protein